MTNLARALRCTLLALTLVGTLGLGVAEFSPEGTLMAGTSGKPGEPDVGSTPLDLQLAGTSGKPGEPDVGSTPLDLQLAGSSGKPGEPDVG